MKEKRLQIMETMTKRRVNISYRQNKKTNRPMIEF